MPGVRWFWPLIAAGTLFEALAAVCFMRAVQEWAPGSPVDVDYYLGTESYEVPFLLAGLAAAALGGVAFGLAAKRR